MAHLERWPETILVRMETFEVVACVGVEIEKARSAIRTGRGEMKLLKKARASFGSTTRYSPAERKISMRGLVPMKSQHSEIAALAVWFLLSPMLCPEQTANQSLQPTRLIALSVRKAR